jgi:hypothetical protein
MPTDAGAGGGARNFSGVRWAGPLLGAAVLAPGAIGLVVLFRRLAAMDNSPEMFQQHAATLSRASMVCGVVAAGVCLALRNGRDDAVTRAMRIAGRTGLVMLVVGIVLWWLPIPFGPTRYVTLLLLAFAGARLGIASMRPRAPGSAAPALWPSGAAAVGAVAMAALVPLLGKLNGLAWAFAID